MLTDRPFGSLIREEKPTKDLWASSIGMRSPSRLTRFASSWPRPRRSATGRTAR